MSIAFIDPPGPLAGTSEPIDFTTTELVTSVSVEYRPSTGTGLRETVWDGTSDADNTGGDFSYLYRTSTRTGSGPYTWTVRRNQPWPADFRIRVKEATPAPAPDPGGQPWGAIYELDFSAQSSQVMAAPGSYTIDGLTWWRKNALKSGNVIQIVNGSGLQISDPSGMLGGVDAPRLCLPIANVPGFNAAAPYQVWAHWTGDSAGGREFTVGLVDAPADASDITAAHNASFVSVGPSAVVGSNDWFLSRNGSNSNFDGPNVAASYTNAESGIFVATSTFDCVLLSASYAGTLPSASPFDYGVYHTFSHVARTNAMAIFTPFWRASAVVKKLVVIQPKIP